MWEPLGHHLQQNVNINQVPVGVGTENVPALAGTPGCDAQGNCNVQTILINKLQPTVFFVPYRGYASIAQRQMTGNSNYNSLQTNFRHAFSYGLTFQAAYTWSHELDNMFQGGGANSGGTNGINDDELQRWYGTGGLNQSQMLILNYVYELPFFKGASNHLVRSRAWRLGNQRDQQFPDWHAAKRPLRDQRFVHGSWRTHGLQLSGAAWHQEGHRGRPPVRSNAQLVRSRACSVR